MKNINEIAQEIKDKNNRKKTQRGFLLALEDSLIRNGIHFKIESVDNIWIGKSKGRDYRYYIYHGRQYWHFIYVPETKTYYEEIQYFKE